jgi:hypothetical protein
VILGKSELLKYVQFNGSNRLKAHDVCRTEAAVPAAEHGSISTNWRGVEPAWFAGQPQGGALQHRVFGEIRAQPDNDRTPSGGHMQNGGTE